MIFCDTNCHVLYTYIYTRTFKLSICGQSYLTYWTLPWPPLKRKRTRGHVNETHLNSHPQLPSSLLQLDYVPLQEGAWALACMQLFQNTSKVVEKQLGACWYIHLSFDYESTWYLCHIEVRLITVNPIRLHYINTSQWQQVELVMAPTWNW